MSKDVHIVFKTLNYVLRGLGVQLTDAEKLLLICLAGHQGKYGIFPSMKLLSTELNKTRRTIIRLIESLTEKKLIAREKGVGVQNQYRLLFMQSSDIHDTSDTGDTSDIHDTGVVTSVVNESYIGITKIITNKPPLSPKKKPEEILDIPDWLPLADWQAYLEHRRLFKPAMTVVAQKRAIKLLEKFRAEGMNVEEIINQSIICGWKGLFPLKQTKIIQQEKKKDDYHDKLKLATERLIQRKANGRAFY